MPCVYALYMYVYTVHCIHVYNLCLCGLCRLAGEYDVCSYGLVHSVWTQTLRTIYRACQKKD
jgi:hypothetical protein